ncbi:N-acetyltransferase [Sphingomonas ginkgonis]|uniref:N-acetyltransferase n=1 Tax=Sphingomonas ginkgonis TaxID=2315330 RepID=A0A3R9Y558_9SPHN|nr:GNAT family N-acetyltransferase [Sphingomonas ginkgonis]RST30368.1 N-acetyltransferase [Sphingomonas ginkgonis]
MSETLIKTERLRLRTWDAADVDPFMAATNTPAVLRWLNGVQERPFYEAMRSRIDACQREHGHGFWIVERKADGVILGFCGLKRVNAPGAPNPDAFEIGWRFREDAWGQGYAKEAAIGTLDHAFGPLGATEVIAMTVAGNRASWGLMERLGMSRRADLDFTDTRFPDPGDLNPTIQYAMRAADWPRARAALEPGS